VVSYLPKIILGFIFMAGLNFSFKKAESEITRFQEKENPKGTAEK
jgi:hypothetical protein